jgi:hypothetical protein
MKLPELPVVVSLSVCNEASSFLIMWVPLLHRTPSGAVMGTVGNCTNVYQAPNTAETQTLF